MIYLGVQIREERFDQCSSEHERQKNYIQEESRNIRSAVYRNIRRLTLPMRTFLLHER